MNLENKLEEKFSHKFSGVILSSINREIAEGKAYPLSSKYQEMRMCISFDKGFSHKDQLISLGLNDLSLLVMRSNFHLSSMYDMKYDNDRKKFVSYQPFDKMEYSPIYRLVTSTRMEQNKSVITSKKVITLKRIDRSILSFEFDGKGLCIPTINGNRLIAIQSKDVLDWTESVLSNGYQPQKSVGNSTFIPESQVRIDYAMRIMKHEFQAKKLIPVQAVTTLDTIFKKIKIS